ncbi:MAG: hypothetical protein DMG12_08615 [Acidobacteria bacterium]|nr:MAG: hypothetical protein DMG12_08615 [Acidobacteriota bacterium]
MVNTRSRSLVRLPADKTCGTCHGRLPSMARDRSSYSGPPSRRSSFSTVRESSRKPGVTVCFPMDTASISTMKGFPTDVAIARNGDIFVSDGDSNSRVVHFSKDGKFIKIIGGTKGSQPGQFDHPHALAIDSKGRLLVLDQQMEAHNARVQVLDQNGTFLEQWKLGGRQPTGIAIAADDTVYIADTDANSITIFKNGRPVDVIGSLQARPHNLALDPGTGVLYMVDPVTQQRAGGNAANNPDAPGGFIKQVIKKK